MRTWQISLDYSANLGDTETVETVCEFNESLADEYGAALGLTRGALSATLTVDDETAVAAISHADRVLRRAAEGCGIPDLGGLIEAHANTWERAEAEIDKPTLPDLVSSVEAAEILHVSRQRVSELRQRPDFPEPVYELRTGPLWVRAGIERFNERWHRKPGRPVAHRREVYR